MGTPLHVFDDVPAIGTTIALDDQVYELIAIEPHVRKDGVSTLLLVWSTSCAYCADPMLVRSGLHVAALNRRCDVHKRPGQRVGGKRRHQPLKVRVRLA